jgi:GNAT superfamily N-acetyltransferase
MSAMATPRAHAYSGRTDLALLLAFASRAFASRLPLNADWHPGDIVWELKGGYDQPHPLTMWRGPEGVEAASCAMSADTLWLEVLPECEHRLPAIVAALERARLDATDDAAPHLSIRAFAGDTRRTAALAAIGYAMSGPEGVWFRTDLAQPLPALAPPSGFRIRDSVGIDVARRAKAHRDAWNDLAQIGMPDVRSSFSTEIYCSLRAAPLYDPALDILVEADDGTLVANCIAWADTTSSVGIFEPVGTHAAYRRRGFARLAIVEGLRRLQARGLRWGGVGTAHFNAPAIATYLSCGFTLFDQTAWWSKTLRRAEAVL